MQTFREGVGKNLSVQTFMPMDWCLMGEIKKNENGAKVMAQWNVKMWQRENLWIGFRYVRLVYFHYFAVMTELITIHFSLLSYTVISREMKWNEKCWKLKEKSMFSILWYLQLLEKCWWSMKITLKNMQQNKSKHYGLEHHITSISSRFWNLEGLWSKLKFTCH